MTLAVAGAAAISVAAIAATVLSVRWTIAALNTTRSTTMRSLQLLDVDGLRALVAVFLFEGDLGRFAERTVTVALNPGEVDEHVTSTPVWGDEADALFVREPRDRAGVQRCPRFDCSGRSAVHIS